VSTEVKTVRTVLGDIAPAELGVCDAHDHLFFRSAQLPGQELDDPDAAAGELRAFRAAGGSALAQWTPFGLGRRAKDLPGVSRDAGVHVIAATGLHQVAHYDPELLAAVRRGDIDCLTALFVDELSRGLRHGDDPAGPVATARAGMVKVAGGFHHLDTHARTTMVAAANAHHATGSPIGIHLELGTSAPDVLAVLCGEQGVPPEHVILGHLNRSPDPRVQREAAESGAFLAFDGPSRANHATDWRLLDELVDLVGAGHEDQLLLGGDTTTAAARWSSGGGPGIPFLLTTLRPRIARELGEDIVTKILVHNPARAFAVRWR
jgi:predicted metal-dependent phosphotriesterase family hydrolase